MHVKTELTASIKHSTHKNLISKTEERQKHHKRESILPFRGQRAETERAEMSSSDTTKSDSENLDEQAKTSDSKD